LVPRETKRWRDLYRGRAAVEREFGRLKHEYGLARLRVRGLAKVQLHADLTMLARLSQALARARVVPLAVRDLSLSPHCPLGDALDVYLCREDVGGFIEEVRGDDPELAKPLRIEERELEAGGVN